MKREKKWGHTHTQTQTTPTRGRIIVADGIYSVGDKKLTGWIVIQLLSKKVAHSTPIYPSVTVKNFLLDLKKFSSDNGHLLSSKNSIYSRIVEL